MQTRVFQNLLMSWVSIVAFKFSFLNSYCRCFSFSKYILHFQETNYSVDTEILNQLIVILYMYTSSVPYQG